MEEKKETDAKTSNSAQSPDLAVQTGKGANTASLANRVGALSAVVFIGSTIFAAACMGWFAFLWWGTVDNSVWRQIVLNNWAIRAISLPSSFFRIAITVQAGLCLSMLAALAIEKAHIPLPSLATISIMRATNPSTTDMITKFIYPIIRSSPSIIPELGVISIVSITALLVLTTSILGFTSTILLTDVVVQSIPSNEIQLSVPVDFTWHYDTRQDPENPVAPGFTYSGSYSYYYWNSSPPSTLPAFAEYSQDPLAAPGVSDTGPTVRSFAPFSNGQQRSSLKRYKGKSLVWDARVICQKPIISNYTTSSEPYRISGQVQNSVSLDIIKESTGEPLNFDIFLPQTEDYYYGRPILYQFEKYNVNSTAENGSGIRSQFKLQNSTSPWYGNTYLIVNQTKVSSVGKDYLARNTEWGEIGRIEAFNAFSSDEETIIIGTLCYSPIDAVDRTIEYSTEKPQAEPPLFTYTPLNGSYEYTFSRPTADLKYMGDVYHFDAILPRLLPGSPGVIFNMSLPESGWAGVGVNATGSDGPWAPPSELNNTASTQNFMIRSLDLFLNATVFFGDGTFGEDGVQTVITSRTWMGDLYLQVKNHPRGGTARALQAVLTMIASTAYSEYLQKFDRFENATIVQFHNVSSPGGPYGTRRGSQQSSKEFSLLAGDTEARFPVGYVVIAVLLVVQTILAFLILIQFLRETSVTRIGDPWQALAQVSSEGLEIESIFEMSRKVHADRSTIGKELEAEERNRMRVGIEPYGGSVRLTTAGKRSTMNNV
ncbi:hypothetical protein H072_1299 [Dactylellina haptotyla CBS 200.50]|uniref:Uncharacterized protein n=1 Tax=Dactylellina haptotyla (strain CBS 200.50) TaxID=1284197 RepID=S8APC2_DACHA|nr:hypothetical protein H072_1299 [Dactylellina haptotyla CBS 200.50]